MTVGEHVDKSRYCIGWVRVHQFDTRDSANPKYIQKWKKMKRRRQEKKQSTVQRRCPPHARQHVRPHALFLNTLIFPFFQKLQHLLSNQSNHISYTDFLYTHITFSTTSISSYFYHIKTHKKMQPLITTYNHNSIIIIN